jgi:hypothetical protein
MGVMNISRTLGRTFRFGGCETLRSLCMSPFNEHRLHCTALSFLCNFPYKCERLKKELEGKAHS